MASGAGNGSGGRSHGVAQPGGSRSAEVSSALAADLPERISGLVSFDLDEDAVTAIAARIDAWLMLEPGERETVGAALRATVDRLWSWAGVADGVLDAAAGRLDRLPRPVGD